MCRQQHASITVVYRATVLILLMCTCQACPGIMPSMPLPIIIEFSHIHHNNNNSATYNYYYYFISSIEIINK